jgi:hypothetical protein
MAMDTGRTQRVQRASKKGELAFAPVWNHRLSDRVPLLAEWTGLEPATPGVTGRYSNQLNYHSISLQIRRRQTVVSVYQVGNSGLQPRRQIQARTPLVGAERLELPTFAL